MIIIQQIHQMLCINTSKILKRLTQPTLSVLVRMVSQTVKLTFFWIKSVTENQVHEKKNNLLYQTL